MAEPVQITQSPSGEVYITVYDPKAGVYRNIANVPAPGGGGGGSATISQAVGSLYEVQPSEKAVPVSATKQDVLGASPGSEASREHGVQRMSPEAQSRFYYEQNIGYYAAREAGMSPETQQYIQQQFGIAPTKENIKEYVKTARQIEARMDIKPEKRSAYAEESAQLQELSAIQKATGIHPTEVRGIVKEEGKTVGVVNAEGKVSLFSESEKVNIEPELSAGKITLEEGWNRDLNEEWFKVKSSSRGGEVEFLGERIIVKPGIQGAMKERTYQHGQEIITFQEPALGAMVVPKEQPEAGRNFFFPGEKQFGTGTGADLEKGLQDIFRTAGNIAGKKYEPSEGETIQLRGMAMMGLPTPQPSDTTPLKNAPVIGTIGRVGKGYYGAFASSLGFAIDLPFEGANVAMGKHKPIPFEQAGGTWKVVGLIVGGVGSDVSGTLAGEPEAAGRLLFDISAGKVLVRGAAKANPVRFGKVEIDIPREPSRPGLSTISRVSELMSETTQKPSKATIYRGVYLQLFEKPSTPLGIKESPAKPLIGVVEGGKLKLGTPKPSEMPSLSKAVFPEQGNKNIVSYPETALDVAVKGTPEAMKAQGFSEADIAKTEFVKDSLRNIMTEKSAFDTGKFPEKTEASNEQATKIEMDVARAQNTPFSNFMNFLTGGEYRKTDAYGSFSEMTQREIPLRRIPGDKEFGKDSKASALSQGKDTVSKQITAGFKAELSTEPTIKSLIDGKKAVEFRYPGDEPGAQGKGLRYGFQENRPRDTVEGLKRQLIGEQMVRKGGASALLQTSKEEVSIKNKVSTTPKQIEGLSADLAREATKKGGYVSGWKAVEMQQSPGAVREAADLDIRFKGITPAEQEAHAYNMLAIAEKHGGATLKNPSRTRGVYSIFDEGGKKLADIGLGGKEKTTMVGDIRVSEVSSIARDKISIAKKVNPGKEKYSKAITDIEQLEKLGIIEKQGGEKIIEPAGHRPKDVADFYAENLNAIRSRRKLGLNSEAQLAEMEVKTKAFRDANWRNPETKKLLGEVDSNLDAYLQNVKPERPAAPSEKPSAISFIRELRSMSVTSSARSGSIMSGSVSPSRSVSPSISPSASVSPSRSLSNSTSTSRSTSLSRSLSVSPSVSMITSPSKSVSPSRSLSSSVSSSLSTSLSKSVSPSKSSSPSASRSVSVIKSPSYSISGSLPRGFQPGRRRRSRRKLRVRAQKFRFNLGYGPRLTALEKTEIEAKTGRPQSIFVRSTPKTRGTYEKNLLGASGRSGLAPKVRQAGFIRNIGKRLGSLNFKFSPQKRRKRR
jgi:hypothetical protein